MEGELPPCVASGNGKLSIQSLRIHPDSHRGNFKGPRKHRIPEEYIPVERPVVIVRSAAVMWFSGFERSPDSHQEGGRVPLYPGVLPLPGG